jgi:ADP-ribosylglycohydrolase
VLETLGGGWVGHEALAIAVCAALSAPDVASGLLLAVNHSGDSDSTGSICGNLLGAARGDREVPVSWLAELEGREAIETLCDDAWTELAGEVGDRSEAEWCERYPGE